MWGTTGVFGWRRGTWRAEVLGGWWFVRVLAHWSRLRQGCGVPCCGVRRGFLLAAEGGFGGGAPVFARLTRATTRFFLLAALRAPAKKVAGRLPLSGRPLLS